MNNNEEPLFIYLLLEEYYQRNYMRACRKYLRDTQDPFDIPDIIFIKYYRLDKVMVREIIDSLQNYAAVPGNTNAIPFHLKFLVTLYHLSNGSYQTPVGNSSLTCMSQPAVSRAVKEICRLITVHLMPQYIKFPTTVDLKNEVKLGFYQKHNMPGILGAIDGTHVEIIAPNMNNLHQPPFVYINRKGKYSVNVMLISDSNCRILAANARYPGSVHDAAIWQMSNIRNFLRNEYEAGDRNSHLIGDSGYGLEPWLFTPITNYNEGTPEALFNSLLKSARNVIERTNGVLKGRFRCLSQHRVLHYNHERAADIIYSCCVLHNLAIDAGLPLEEDDIEIENAVADYNQNNLNVLPQNLDMLERGRRARDNYIARNINN